VCSGALVIYWCLEINNNPQSTNYSHNFMKLMYSEYKLIKLPKVIANLTVSLGTHELDYLEGST